jgi:glutaredoxin
MLLVVGTENCSRCNATKGCLNAKEVEYEYKLMSSLSTEEQDRYIQMAQEKHQMLMPLIFKDGQLITLQEV